MKLHDQSCTPSTDTTPELTIEERTVELAELNHPWQVNPKGHLQGTFDFPDFVRAMEFANQITDIAEAENHHPDLHIRWGQCRVEIWTHTIDGISHNDLILAAKIEALCEIES